MALPALTWRQLPVQTLAAGYTITTLLDAIYTALGSTTYVNGAARTPGSGVAWTVSRFQSASVTQAVYAYPPTNTLTQQVILAGATSLKTPTMAASASGFAVNTLYGALAKNAGAFSSWDAAAPFTSGQFSGYVGVHTVQATYGLAVRVYESQDGIFVLINAATTASSNYFFAGGLVDPETGDTTSDAESDGKLYTLGCGNVTLGTVQFEGGLGGAAAASKMFAHQYASAATSANNKCLAFTPGGSTLLGLSRTARYTMMGTAFSSRAGKYARLPIILSVTDTALNYTDPPITYAGRLREICLTRKAVSGSTLRSSGTDVGYYASDDVSSAAGCVILSC
jgi:hypothetical protein